MTGPEHYAKAEQHIESARCLKGDNLTAEDRHLRYAQAHATLAMAAAYTTVGVSEEVEPMLAEWRKVAGGAS